MRTGLWLGALAVLVGCSDIRNGPAATDGGEGGASPFDSGVATDSGGSGDVVTSGDSSVFDSGSPGDSSAAGDTSMQGDTGVGADTGGGGDAGGCAGQPCVLADNQSQATVVIVDNNNVYWGTEGGNGSVNQCPKTGCTGAPIQLGVVTSTGLAVDSQYVYWGDFSGGTLDACTIGGCSMSPIVVSSAEPNIEGVISDGTNLYWASGANIRACTLPCDGTSGHQPRPVGTAVMSTFVIDLAVDQGNVFWADNTAQKIYGCSVASCASPTALAPGAGAGMFASHQVLYFVGTSNAVNSCSESGCNMMPLTIGTSFVPENIVSDGINVYWRDDVSGDILKCPTSGCTGGSNTYQPMQQGQPGGRMALDGQYLYWATASQVLRFPK